MVDLSQSTTARLSRAFGGRWAAAAGGAVPFTGSHPALVLPLLRLGLPASALVIGSLVPDLPYYLPTPVTAAETHTLAGVFGANVLLGVGAFLVWHLVLVPPLLWAAPEGLQRRIPNNLRPGIARRLDTAGDLARVCLALVIGALTHVVWDAFTHAGMWGPRGVPWLTATVSGFTLFRWLHLASSLAGLACLAWFGVRWWRGTPAIWDCAPISPTLRWSLVAGLLGWSTWAATRAGVEMFQLAGPVNVAYLPVEILTRFLSTAVLGLVGFAVAWHVAQALRTERDPARPGTMPPRRS